MCAFTALLTIVSSRSIRTSCAGQEKPPPDEICHVKSLVATCHVQARQSSIAGSGQYASNARALLRSTANSLVVHSSTPLLASRFDMQTRSQLSRSAETPSMKSDPDILQDGNLGWLHRSILRTGYRTTLCLDPFISDDQVQSCHSGRIVTNNLQSDHSVLVFVAVQLQKSRIPLSRPGLQACSDARHLGGR